MGIQTNILSSAKPVQPVLTIRDIDTVTETARLMQRHHVGSLIVVDETDKVAGIITERDIIVSCMAQAKDPDDILVGDIMTTDIVSVNPGATVNDADELMAAHGIRHLPMIDKGKAVGMISARDVMTARLGTVQAMKDAAEQIALLSKNVRNLDLQEILNRLADGIPNVFGAKRWALHLSSEDQSSDTKPLIQRMNCPCSIEMLTSHPGCAKPVGDEPHDLADPPETCQRLGAAGCHAMVSLNLPASGDAREHRREGDSNYLCMCGLPNVTKASADVLSYKLALVTEILTVNFTNARLYRVAYRDPLTGLRTRRALEEALEYEHSRGLRYGRAFCLAMLDVDNFKSVNDTYGHAVGDAVLTQFGETLLADVRAYDLPTRYGGDEMAVLMPETKLQGALAVIRRLRRRLDNDLRTPSDRPVTVSCGIAEWSGQAEETGADVILRADKALYEAKRSGRNRVVVSDLADSSDLTGTSDLPSRQRATGLVCPTSGTTSEKIA